MALPLPKIVPDQPVEGYALAGLGAANALRRQNMENAFYPQITQADIANKLAMSQLANSETAMNAWKAAHPYSMLPDTLALLEFMRGNTGSGGDSPSGSGNPNAPTNALTDVNTSTDNSATNPLYPYNTNSYGNPNQSNPNSLIQSKLDPAAYQAKLHQQQANFDTNQKLIQDATDQASDAVNLGYDLQNMQTAYPSLNWMERGPLLGSVRPFSDAAQKFDLGASGMLTNLSRQNQSGHITNQDFQLFQKMVAGRQLNPDSFKTLSDYTKALQQRIQEKPAFYTAAAQLGLPPAIYQPLYTKYLHERPVYDFNKEQSIPGNLNSWKDYLNKNAINAMLQGKDYSPRISLENDNSQTETQQQPQMQKVTNQNNNSNGPSAGAVKLSKNTQWPSFKSKNDMNAWFKKQPKMVQDAFYMHLRGQ